jgi:transcriptional regulator with XRE-family HTH domain
MISDTLVAGLEAYKIGAKVRALRTEKGIGLVQLGKHSGLSPALLSKIERGQMFPTLPTLLRISLVFGVGLEHFFSAAEPRPTLAVVRRTDRLRFPDSPGKGSPSYFFQSLDFPVTERKMQAFLAEFPSRGSQTNPHTHAGVEFIYVISGWISVTVDETPTVLAKGDAIYFDSGFPHFYKGVKSVASTAIVVVQEAKD